ncbi:nitrate- and nitrite sensing domain-containing protein [Parafrankia sp. FMc6]|uniref:sensor histidine kinase n=1 Tax=Parafrankia soli TaxID=2599596 RepID=UPI0034D646F0
MLRNWPIRSKLVVILIVPLAALAVLSAIQVRGDVDNVRAANRIEALADFSIKGNNLVHVLQRERYATNSYVGSNFLPMLGQQAVDARKPVDDALAVYLADEQALPASARDALGTTLSSIRTHLDQLGEHRKQLDARQTEIASNGAFYNEAVNELLLLNARIAAGSSDAKLVNGATTLAGIAQAKEQASQQRGAVAQILSMGGQATPQMLRALLAYAGAETAWTDQFRTTATPAQLELFTNTVGRSATGVNQMRDDVVSWSSGQQALPPSVALEAWRNAADGKIAQMHDVEVRIANDLAATSRDIASTASRDALLGSIGVAFILVLSVVISLLVASPMISQLRRLRGGALDVANERLPSVVDRLHRGEPVDIDAESFPVPATSKDEIGQLAEAFATVHEVAVRTAVEQAAMRKSIEDTFLNLARRSQALIHRQLKIIDALERKETDPDELEELFRLDHLATRMRRHAEDLIVLSGSKPARGWRRPVPIKDVVRGAVAEVEDYTRVKVLPITGGAVSGHAVGDVIHMFAELIENATSFSPPHTPVQVAGHPVSNGFVVEIEDRGLGMNPEEIDALNNRLANPPPFDLSTSERLGLFVVSRLAERHDVQVRLRPSPYGGTMAIVLLPATLLRASDDKGEDSSPREFAAVGASSAGTQGSDLAGSLNGIGDRVNGAGGAGPESNGHWAGDIPGDALDAAALSAGGAVNGAGTSADETLIDDLPVFATARSSWFVAEKPGGRNRTDDEGDDDGPVPPRRPGELTGPTRRAELPPSRDGAGYPDDAGAGRNTGWSDGRSDPAASLFGPPPGGGEFGGGSLFSAPPDTGQFSGFGPNGFGDGGGYGDAGFGDGGGYAGGFGGGATDAGANGMAGNGSGGFADSDYHTAEFSRSGFGTGGGLGTDGGPGNDGGFGNGGGLGQETGDGFGSAGGFGSSDGFGSGDGFGSADSQPGAGLPSRSRTGRASGDYARADYTPPGQQGPAGDGTGYREPRADRGQEFGRPMRENGYGGAEQAYPGRQDGGIGDGAFRRSARSSHPGQSTGGGSAYPGANPPPAAPPFDTGAAAAEESADDGLDELGLPKRRRRANLAPQLRRENADAGRSSLAAGPRSPEEIRSMMSSFQANFGRGIEDGTVSNDGDDVRKVT